MSDKITEDPTTNVFSSDIIKIQASQVQESPCKVTE